MQHETVLCVEPAIHLSQAPITARQLARALGLKCADVVPVLNKLRADGDVVRVSLSEDGLVGWRLP